MANTYTQLYTQIVFGVKYRQPLIHPTWENELYKYMNGTIQQLGHKPIAINGVSDHVHLFVGLNPNAAISELVKSIKISSNKLVNGERWCNGKKFEWQGGFGAFSYSKKDVPNVYNYIMNQKEHHKIKTFEEEYLELLREYEVNFDPRFLL
jgi:REP element-mobilizing transposase RayT